jgi:hypothetical protein
LRYGPGIVRDNIFTLGASTAPDAVTFAPNGHDLRMTGNVFQGRPAAIRVSPGSEEVEVREKSGAETRVAPPVIASPVSPRPVSSPCHQPSGPFDL